MKLRIVAAAVLVAALVPSPVHGVERAAPRTVRLDGVSATVSPTTRQVVTVNRTRGTHARVALWQRNADGRWTKVLHSGTARIGYGGLVRGAHRKQGSGTTPLGTYPLLYAFGTGAPVAGTALPYRQVGPQDYWVEDNRSAYYNRYRSKADGGFRYWLDPRSVNGSERLAATPHQYELAVVVGYNYTRPVHYRGAGIFLHVNGSGPTAGCVSAPLWFLRRVVATLDPAERPVIAIGR